MTTPLAPAELARKRRAYRKMMLRRSEAKRFARLLPFNSPLSRPGDMEWRAIGHHRPAASAVLHLRLDEHIVGYEISYEGWSGWWLILPEGTIKSEPEWAGVDVFDQLMACNGLIGPTREDAMVNALLLHGFLAPWIGTTSQAAVARRRFQRSLETWPLLMASEDDLGTTECEGCDDCVPSEGTRVFHRVAAPVE